MGLAGLKLHHFGKEEPLHRQGPKLQPILDLIKKDSLVEGVLINHHHTLVCFHDQIGVKNLHKPAGSLVNGKKVFRYWLARSFVGFGNQGGWPPKYRQVLPLPKALKVESLQRRHFTHWQGLLAPGQERIVGEIPQRQGLLRQGLLAPGRERIVGEIQSWGRASSWL